VCALSVDQNKNAAAAVYFPPALSFAVFDAIAHSSMEPPDTDTNSRFVTPA
jgi:hypothetical protein